MHFRSTGDGHPFIFQHGLGSNIDQPQGLLAALPKVQLVSMDCPGHGQAPLLPNQTPSFNYYTDQVASLMEHLRLEKAILGGISMGAGIATNLALRYKEKVSALVLLRPAWLAQGYPQNLQILIEAAKKIGKIGGLEAFKERKDFQAIENNLPKAAQSVLGVFGEGQRPELPLVLESMVKDHPFEQLSHLNKIKVPTLIIANEDDPLHPFEMAEIIHQNIPGSKLEKICSRYIDNDKHKEEVFQLVSKFINNE